MWFQTNFFRLKRTLLSNYVRAVREGERTAIIRFVFRASTLVFLSMFKWTIPLVIMLMLRQFT
jgi:hypothetical protein